MNTPCAAIGGSQDPKAEQGIHIPNNVLMTVPHFIKESFWGVKHNHMTNILDQKTGIQIPHSNGND